MKTIAALLAALSLHGTPAPPRHATYSSRARDLSYERRMMLPPNSCIPAIDGHGFVCPMPLPPPHRKKKR